MRSTAAYVQSSPFDVYIVMKLSTVDLFSGAEMWFCSHFYLGVNQIKQHGPYFKVDMNWIVL